MFRSITRRLGTLFRAALFFISIVAVPYLGFKTLMLFDGASGAWVGIPITLIFCICYMYPLGAIFSIMKVFKSIASVPYWGEKLGQDHVDALLENEVFYPYTYKDGHDSLYIKISENRKWLKIFGKYYPVAFIAGIDKSEMSLVMLNGERVPLKPFVFLPSFSDALYEIYPNYKFFRDRIKADNYEESFQHIFESACGNDLTELHKADWEHIRYTFERAFANLTVDSEYANLKQSIFSYVLGKNQLKKLKVRKNRDKGISADDEILNFDEYEDDYCICNGVALLNMIGYPSNKAGIDFLFRCLGNADAPYFQPAVEELEKFDRKLLQDKIDLEVEKAYSEKDALKLGGIIFLAERIGYDVPFIKEIKEEQAKEEEIGGKDMFHFMDEDYTGKAGAMAVAFEPEKIKKEG
jgi:hypothetical protein